MFNTLADNVQWTSNTPTITMKFEYERQRSGADMRYRFRTTVYPLPSSAGSFGFSIIQAINLNGTSVQTGNTIKANSPSTWTSNYVVTSPWFTVSNKTSGTVPVSFIITSSGTRNQTNNYNLAVDPAFPVMSINSSSRTVSSITLNLGSTIATPTNIQITSSGSTLYSGTSMNPTISSLAPNTNYTLVVSGYANGGWGPTTSITIRTFDIARISTSYNFNDTGNPRIDFTNPSGQQIDAWILVGSTVIAQRNNISQTSPYIWTLSGSEVNSLLQLTPNSNSLTLNYVIRTASNNSYTNTSVNRTMTVTNANPTFTNFTFADTNSTTTALTGNNQIMIAGYSNCQFTIPPMTANKYATAKTYTVLAGTQSTSVNYSSSTINTTLNGVSASSLTATSITLRVTANDSRGNNTIVSKSTTLKPYSLPLIQNSSTSRVGAINEQTTITANGTFTNWSGLAVANTVTSARFRYRRLTNGVWGSWSGYTSIATSNFTISGGTWSLNNYAIIGDTTNGFNTNYGYEVQLQVYDQLNSVTRTSSLNTASPLLWKDIANVMLGVGKKPSLGQLDVYGDIYTNGNIVGVLGIGYPISSGDDLNNYTTLNTYYSQNSTISGSLSNTPYTSGGFRLIVSNVQGTATIRQTIEISNSSYISTNFSRFYNGTTWTSWLPSNMVWGQNVSTRIGQFQLGRQLTQWGSFTATGSANTDIQVSVTYNQAYASTPIPLFSTYTTSTPANWNPVVLNATSTTGFTATVRASVAISNAIYWYVDGQASL